MLFRCVAQWWYAGRRVFRSAHLCMYGFDFLPHLAMSPDQHLPLAPTAPPCHLYTASHRSSDMSPHPSHAAVLRAGRRSSDYTQGDAIRGNTHFGSYTLPHARACSAQQKTGCSPSFGSLDCEHPCHLLFDTRCSQLVFRRQWSSMRGSFMPRDLLKLDSTLHRHRATGVESITPAGNPSDGMSSQSWLELIHPCVS
jgi:hypothetical protein